MSSLAMPAFERVPAYSYTETPSSSAPIRPQAIYNEGKKLVSSTQKMADEIIGSNNSKVDYDRYDRAYAPRYSYWYPYSFWSPFCVDPYPTCGRRDEENGLRFLVGLIASIIGGVALYTVGAKISTINEADEELRETMVFKSKFQSYAQGATEKDANYCDKLARLADLKAKVFKRLKKEAIKDLTLTVALVSGSVLALIGSLYATIQMVNIGIGIGVVAGAAILVRWGMDSTSKQNIREAQAIQQAIKEI